MVGCLNLRRAVNPSIFRQINELKKIPAKLISVDFVYCTHEKQINFVGIFPSYIKKCLHVLFSSVIVNTYKRVYTFLISETRS